MKDYEILYNFCFKPSNFWAVRSGKVKTLKKKQFSSSIALYRLNYSPAKEIPSKKVVENSIPFKDTYANLSPTDQQLHQFQELS